MLLAPQMSIIFVISTSNNPIINTIKAWMRWRTSNWHLPLILLVRLTRARPGGGNPPPSLRFFADCEKRRRVAPPNLPQLFSKQLTTFPKKNDDPMTRKVTPPGHIKWPDLKLHFSKFETFRRHIEDPNSLKLAVCNTDIGIYDLYISDFLYRWPQVMPFSWPPHYKSMVKKWSTSNAHQICQNHPKS